MSQKLDERETCVILSQIGGAVAGAMILRHAAVIGKPSGDQLDRLSAKGCKRLDETVAKVLTAEELQALKDGRPSIDSLVRLTRELYRGLVDDLEGLA